MQVDGLAASIASVILMAGDTIKVASNAFVMIHNAWTFTMGNARELRQTADVLDKIDGTIAATYAARTGMSEADVLKLTAAEALEKGFADEQLPAVTVKASVRNGRYKHTPAALLNGEPEPMQVAAEPVVEPANRRAAK